MRYASAALLVLLLSIGAQAALRTEAVEYRQGDTLLQGYLAYDTDFQGKRPGVLVVHEWWGLVDYPKNRAEELAKLGYVAFALDMYGKGKSGATPQEAGQLAGAIRGNVDLMRARAQAALEALKRHERTDPRRTAAVGYCFGGGVALELARSGADLKGVVTFHGSLATQRPQDAKNIKGRVLVLHGSEDRSVTPAHVAAFQEEMRSAGVDWQLNIYSGATHAFSNPAARMPERGLAYHEQAATRSWEAMKLFLADIFK
ncbi:MAG: dienelactone hydrolase family protein [Candidatus Tectomicrobia bacterium]|nr:dienelactone hydrolase family protein [Candidatus Tectomicrobia bacterium]